VAEATGSLHELTATELRAAIEQGECGAVDAVEASLARIEACNADLNAVCFVYADDARADARRLDRNRRANGGVSYTHLKLPTIRLV
jgi:amidase